MIIPQSYPRITDQQNLYFGCLDETSLVDHIKKLSVDDMNNFISRSIEYAERKSSRQILNIPDNATPEETSKLYKKAGKQLFNYFVKYNGDPAASAHQLFNQDYKKVATDQFRLQTLQKERMNSGWRYQFLAFECAKASNRFRSVSDIGASEADFNAVINYKDESLMPLSLYVSVKNRDNTLGGQDWPKAIQALEQVASTDRNRLGNYLCVFGITMDKRNKSRLIKTHAKTKLAYSHNTEIWYANYFWPFFANYCFDEIMSLVLDVLLKTRPPELATLIPVPQEVIDSFKTECDKKQLLDPNGYFNDPHKLVEIFCKK